MDGPRDCRKERSMSDKDKYHLILLTWYIFKNSADEPVYRNTVIDVENKHGYQKGKGGDRSKLGDWNCHVHTTMYKIDN